MAAKRKDKNGRLLKTGENQRKDSIYQYRYQDIWGKTQYLYSADLDELRQKEREVQKELEKGVDYAKGNVSVEQLVERYIGLKQNVRYNTKV
ncbi:MAG: integrase DNA-binding domain-containing protein, partial [Lachnospiraceae bacterium]|nr:integrase DNA-binding domain-containing protein [Lachnospiraceae bacterium]